MGHEAKQPRAAKAALALLTAALLILALASSAQAAPIHVRHEALDVTGLNHACGVAVDSKGDLYASSAGTGEVKVYDSEHKLLTSIEDANQPCGLAVSPTGVLYVSEKATGEVVRFKPNVYPFAGTPNYGPREVIDSSTKAKGIAVDRFDGALYVAEGTRVFAYVHELQSVVLAGAITGGTFKLKFEGSETGSIPYNASAAEVQAALEALSTIGAGNVEVAEPLPFSYSVFFTGKFAYTDVPTNMSGVSSLTGTENPRVSITETAKGSSGPIGEGLLSEASGVAAYTAEGEESKADRYLAVADANGIAADRLYLFSGQSIGTLKPRRELTGATTPDGSFGFGAAGASLAADPGNVKAKKCATVGEEACTAGHIFLFDAAHKALDEFDGSGEYLDQAKNAAFADAEPTAIAVDRSGGANDGTVYVTAGAGTGAEALAFRPLVQPSRETLSEPISHILKNARAVATDSSGYVYAAAGTKVSIYKPDGTEVTSFTDASGSRDLAVDSKCNVYVLDGEAKVTYYTPSACPPAPGTTYTRHEPAVALGSEFPIGSKNLKGIAVNPGPSSGKDHLFVTGVAVTREYDSAANGSGLLKEEFATGLTSGLRQSIAVNGANGNVYIGTNSNPIYVTNPAGTEVLARIDPKISTTGTTGSNPFVAVDQANGHVVEFDGKSKRAHEYDAVSGAFVAEFGNFTEELTKEYRLAVDNACAINGLTGEACKAFDPANGNVYVAFDDANESHPPYDVTAFGPLKYGTPPAAPKFKLTVERAGTGTGTVTSQPEGISCGGGCTEFEEGTKVTLAAAPTGGSSFAGWTGAGCTGTGSCEVTMSAAKEVTATFTAPVVKFNLKVQKAGTGTGTVSGGSPAEPATINCGATCEHEYLSGALVTLAASPSGGSSFAGWTGAGCTGTGSCEVTMSAAKEVTATFTAPVVKFNLKVQKAGTGTGTVSGGSPAEPATINCGATCEHEYLSGALVTLAASPSGGSSFAGWTGAGCTGTGSCEVTMSAAKEVTATFTAPVVKFNLKVQKAGTGTGTVSGGSPAEPATINCGATCEHEYLSGALVTLAASPSGGSSFAGWTGAGCTGTGSCEVTMSAAKEVTATFTLIPRTLSTTKSGSGSGTVKCEINGGPAEACAASYPNGTSVKLTATAEAGSSFAAFSAGSGSASSCATSPCTFTIEANSALTATFNLIGRTLTITKAGSGTGEVKCEFNGGSAGACTSPQPNGTSVEIIAFADADSEFTVFSAASGSASGCSGKESNFCSFTLEADSSVTATFDLKPPPTLYVTVKPSGSGTVTSTPAGIECSSEPELEAGCVAEFERGTVVTLNPHASPGYEFAGWQGPGGSDCFFYHPCELTMNGDEGVRATFRPEEPPPASWPSIESEFASGLTSTNAVLNAEIDPNSESGIAYQFQLATDPDEYYPWPIFTCAPEPSGSLCAPFPIVEGALPIEFFQGETQVRSLDLSSVGVTLQPGTTYHYRVLAAPYHFTEDLFEWEEPVVTGADQTFTTSSEEETGPANPTTLTIAKTGNGTVVSAPSGIECGPTCSHAFELNELITLTASPASGYAFNSWSGCKTHEGLTCTVEMDKAKTVKASFFPTPSLKIEKAGTGTGKVTTKGISCDAGCPVAESSVKTATALEVKATPSKGSEVAIFESGTGNAGSCASSCAFTITEDSSVKVRFEPAPTKSITVNLTGPGAYKGSVKGKGTVKGLSSAALSCAAGCTSATEAFFATDEIELSAKAATGYAFKGWSVQGGSAGTCTGTTTPCSVKTDADKTIEAEFK